MKVLHSICQQIWKTQQWPQDWKSSVFISIPKKGSVKECSNYHMIALISHTSMEKALAPTPVLLPGKFHGRRSLGGYSPWSHEESDTTERLHALEKEMATHSTVLAWKISGKGEPGRLPSMGSHRDGQDWSHLAAAAAMLAKQCSKFSKSDFNST